jgi:hypothetical protein
MEKEMGGGEKIKANLEEIYYENGRRMELVQNNVDLLPETSFYVVYT